MFRKNILFLFFILSFFKLTAQEQAGTEENLVTNESNMQIENIEYVNWSLINPIFSPETFEMLPNTSHFGSFLEYVYPGAILSNPDTAGFSLLEPVTINTHGESVKWQKYYINSMNISNPGMPGKPLIYMPEHLFNSFQVNSQLRSYRKDHGYNWQVNTAQEKSGKLYLSNPGHIGGPTWMPSEFDREPAQEWGAAEKTRRFGPSLETAFDYSFEGINEKKARIFYESIYHNRTFLNLDDYENGYRNTLYFSHQLSENKDMALYYQNIQRDHYGIETGHNDENSLKENSNALLIQFYKPKDSNQNNYYLFSAGFIQNDLTQNSKDSMVIDLFEKALFYKNLTPETKNSWFSEFHYNLLDFNKLLSFALSSENSLRIEGSHVKQTFNNNILARTYYGQPLDITIFETNNPYHQEIIKLYSSIILEQKFKKADIQLTAGLQSETAFSNFNFSIFRIEPNASLSLNYFLTKNLHLFSGLQHDAIPLTLEEVSFLNKKSLSGARYNWNDNGNDVPEKNEAGNVLSKTGGLYHVKNNNLSYPSREEIYTGISYDFLKYWRYFFSVHAKRFTGLYFVDYDSSVNSGYSKITRSDSEIGYLYNRDINSFGNEIFQLTNSSENGYYAAAETQILKKYDSNSPWFIQISIGGYYAQAKTIMGNGYDYNDMGQFDESSANKNKQLNTLARVDFDRGYTGHLLFGAKFFKQFLWSNILRYRDGQPFGELLIVEGLTEGPVLIQNKNRSNPPVGMPRFTYALSWDVRLAYDHVFKDKEFTVSLDIYNLLDSRAELYEYTLSSEKYRDALETGGRRSYRLNMSYKWK
ncbi:MAG: hypothetical protein OEZ22_06315 [Spirochaetia bacterium]|nr:hypothetical protein [Spirochaetia bacterium]